MGPIKRRKIRSATDASEALADVLPWHEQFAAKIASQPLAPATMIVGKTGDGLELLCRSIAGRILSADSSESLPLLEAGTHPDFHTVRLQLSTTGKLRQEIVIDQARELIKFMQYAPVVGKLRIAVIVPVCRLNRNAANALLKLLEEPPPTAHFILGADQPERLPATVRSRLRRVYAPHPTSQQAQDWLAANGIVDTKAVLEANGTVLQALEMPQNVHLQASFARVASGRTDIITGYKELMDVPASSWINWAQLYIEDLVACKLGLTPTHYPSNVLAEAFKNIRASKLQILNVGRELLEMKRLAQHPVNERLLFERVAIRLQKLAS